MILICGLGGVTVAGLFGYVACKETEAGRLLALLHFV